MARIETYDLDSLITSNDVILGSDGNNNNKTKNYLVGHLKNYIIGGLVPIVGGTLKITEVIGDIGEVLPQTVMNTLTPSYFVEPYEIIITTCSNGTKYLFKKNNAFFGVDEVSTVLNDFIKIYENATILTPPDGSETKVNAGTNVTVSGNGTTVTPYVVNASSQSVNDANGSVKGIVKLAGDLGGTADLPTVPALSTKVNNTGNQTLPLGFTLNYVAKTGGTSTQTLKADGSVVEDNLQKTITSSYTLLSADANYIIFVNNGATAITITVPTGLLDKFECGFVQQGTGLVTFVASGVTLNTPSGLKIKGQNYNAYVTKIGSTNVFHLLGNLIV